MRDWSYRQLIASASAPQLASLSPAALDHHLGELFSELDKLPRAASGSLPAGYTYLGQLIAHDITHLRQTDAKPQPAQHLTLSRMKQARKPVLDLDTIYGAGLDDSAVPYCRETGKFKLGSSLGTEYAIGDCDLPRDPLGVSLIADIRNDQNLLIAQMQVLFMNFHNKVVDHFVSSGLRGADQLFALARTEVLHVYHHIVLHDFCWQILPVDVYDTVLIDGEGLLGKPDKHDPSTAIEFVTAAFRLHSMVRSGYRVSAAPQGAVSIDEMFKWTGKHNACDCFLPQELVVDWRKFFPPDEPRRLADNVAKALSTTVSTFVIDQHTTHQMRRRSCERALQLRLASGQEAHAHLLQQFPSVYERLGLRPLQSAVLQNLPDTNPFKQATPLWIYLMLEAGNGGNVNKLGTFGGWLVADSIRTALHSTEQFPPTRWSPAQSVLFDRVLRHKKSHEQRWIAMKDLVRYTYH